MEFDPDAGLDPDSGFDLDSGYYPDLQDRSLDLEH